MSKLERLIQQYCPDGVEYYKVKDIYKRIKGTPITAGKMKEIANSSGSVRIFAGGKTAIDANEEDIPNATITKVPAVLVQSRGVIDVIYYDKPFTFKNELWGYTTDNKIAVKYLYYVLKNNVQVFRDAASGMGALPQISLKVTEDFEIPVPPLPVQEEIVRILDTFTELQAELQAELQKRQQQYNFYRDNLLNFNREGQEIKWMKLKDVAIQWYRGAGIKRDEVGKEGTPCIRYGEIHTTYNIWFKKCISHTDEYKQATKKYAEYGDILFAITSEDIPLVGNSVAYLGKEKILVGGDIVVMKHNQDPKYMAYALSTSDAIKQKGKGKVKSKVVHTNVPSLQEIVIPIPPIEEQQRIANILDRFDTLTNDLTSGLPAEMEKRRQQYEYYRDRLLTFKRL